jgi:hypothetical protein
MNIEIIKRLDDENEIEWVVMQPFRLSLVGALKALTYLTSFIGKKRSQEFKSYSKFIK